MCVGVNKYRNQQGGSYFGNFWMWQGKWFVSWMKESSFPIVTWRDSSTKAEILSCGGVVASNNLVSQDTRFVDYLM